MSRPSASTPSKDVPRPSEDPVMSTPPQDSSTSGSTTGDSPDTSASSASDETTTQQTQPTPPTQPTQSQAQTQSQTSQSPAKKKARRSLCRFEGEDLVKKWTARIETVSMEDCEIENEVALGQTRSIDEGHVAEIMMSTGIQPPTDLEPIIVWETPEQCLIPVDGQHWVIAAQRMAQKLEEESLDVPRWMTHARATILKTSTPLDVRERIGGRQNAARQVVRQTNVASMARLYLVERSRDPDGSWDEQWISAVEKAGNLLKFRKEIKESSKIKDKSNVTLVYPTPLVCILPYCVLRIAYVSWITLPVAFTRAARVNLPICMQARQYGPRIHLRAQRG